MIKALILVHLWSFVIAGCAWALQHDGNGRVGARFPAANIWLILILLSVLPGAFHLIPFGPAIDLSEIAALEIFTQVANENPSEGATPINYFAIYVGLGALLMGRTLLRWARLQSLPLDPTEESDIFTTSSDIPPLTLSWPRRVLVLPYGLEAQDALIAHERAHLRHHDAELTLFLLLLRDIMLRNPGISYLVRQWRLAIELRADQAATRELSTSQRKDYAALLLNVLRPGGDRSEALPCPTAHLTSARHRSAKLRLTEIMESGPNSRKRRWTSAVLMSAIAASLLGVTTSAAIEVRYLDFDPIEYSKQNPPKIPASCPGLKRDDVKFETRDVMVNGNSVTQHTMDFGVVGLHHDVRRDGSIHNPRVLFSTNACFEAEAKTAIIQWETEPQNFETRDAGVKLHFIVSAPSLEDLESKLSDYLR